MKKLILFAVLFIIVLSGYVYATDYLPIQALNSAGGTTLSDQDILTEINTSDDADNINFKNEWINVSFNVTGSPSRIYLAMAMMEKITVQSQLKENMEKLWSIAD